MRTRTPALVLPLALAACGEDPGHNHDHEHETEFDGAMMTLACSAMQAAGTSVAAADTADAAATVVLSPGQSPSEVALQADTAGFVTLSVPTDHTDAYLFIGPNTGVVAISSDGNVVYAFDDGAANTECSDAVESMHAWHVHVAGDYLLEFEAGAERTATFVFYSALSDHADHDAGMHDHDAMDHDAMDHDAMDHDAMDHDHDAQTPDVG